MVWAATVGRSPASTHCRIDTSHPTQVVQTERVLHGEAGAIRALAVSPAGAVYLVNDRSLLELVPEP